MPVNSPSRRSRWRVCGRGLAIRYDTAAKERLTVHSPRPLPRGVYKLEIAFRAKFNTRATALYPLKSEGEWYSFTQFEPDDAVPSRAGTSPSSRSLGR
jgi:aminopeptidase N